MKKNALLPALLLLAALLMPSEAFSFGQNKVRYNDFDWKIMSTPHFRIYFYKGGEMVVKYASKMAEQAYAQIGDDLKIEFDEPIPLIIYKSHYEFEQTNVILEMIDKGVGGFSEVFKSRIVIPFNGSYVEFRRVLSHELTHIYSYKLLYGDIFKAIVSNQTINPPPMWLMEGLAEFESSRCENKILREMYSSEEEYKNDYSSEMVLRDAVINDGLIPITYLDNFYILPGEYMYYAYQQSRFIIEHIYEKYGIEKVSHLLKLSKSLQNTDGLIKTITRQNLDYFDESFRRGLKTKYYRDIGRQVDPREYALPLYKNEMERIPLYRAVWSPGGDMLAAVSPKSGRDEIYLVRNDGEILENLTVKANTNLFEEVNTEDRPISWNRQGTHIAFIAKKNGKDCIFIRNLMKKEHPRIIELEKFDSLNSLCYSPDGRFLAFSGLSQGRQNLYILSLKNGAVTAITDNFNYCTQPDWSPDGAKIAFAEENYDGLSDIRLYHIESGKTQAVSISGMNCSGPSWDTDSRGLFFIAADTADKIFNLYFVREGDTGARRLTKFFNSIYNPRVIGNTGKLSFEFFEKGFWNLYSAEKGALLAAGDTCGGPVALQEPIEKDPVKTILYRPADPDTAALQYSKYKFKLFPDWLSSEITYGSYGTLNGYTRFSASDILGNHRFIVLADFLTLTQSINNWNAIFQYYYLAKRFDFGVGVFHNKNTFKNYDFIFLDSDFGSKLYVEKETGLWGYVGYPIDKYRRLDFSLNLISTAYSSIFSSLDRKEGIISSFNIAYSKDNTLWYYIEPNSGSRSLTVLGSAVKFGGNFLQFNYLNLDLRKYFSLGPRTSIALRFQGGISRGYDNIKYSIGGAETLRGYPYGSFEGDQFALVNAELRIPFIDMIDLKLPLPIILTNIRGVLFFDMGLASAEGQALLPMYADEFRFRDIKASAGVGFRLALGILPLKVDYAYNTDLKTFDKIPYVHFSIYYDY